MTRRRRPRILTFPAKPKPEPITVTNVPGPGLSMQLTFALPAIVAAWRKALEKGKPEN